MKKVYSSYHCRVQYRTHRAGNLTIIKPRGRNVSTPLMFLNGDALEYVDSVKYLGVLLSQDMKDDADMSRHLRSIYARSNVIFRKFHHCSASIKYNDFCSIINCYICGIHA